MLIDGTGKNYDKISNMKRQLQKQGYDCYMIFVNTSLKVALERNSKRSRKVPEDVVRKGHAAVSNNMGRFQGLFGGSNMLIVDNSEYKDFEDHVVKAANKFITKPIRNKVAKKWIAKEMELKKS